MNEKFKEAALQCKPQTIAKELIWEIKRNKKASVELLELDPYICDGTGEEIEAACRVIGFCSRVMREFQSEEFRQIFLGLVREHIDDKSIILEIKCFGVTKDDGSMWINESYIEATLNPNSLDEIIEIAAKLFDYPPLQFSIFVSRDNEMANALMQHSVSYYQNCIEELNAISDEQERSNARARYKQQILNKEPSELIKMKDKMYDMYLT